MSVALILCCTWTRADTIALAVAGQYRFGGYFCGCGCKLYSDCVQGAVWLALKGGSSTVPTSSNLLQPDPRKKNRRSWMRSGTPASDGRILQVEDATTTYIFQLTNGTGNLERNARGFAARPASLELVAGKRTSWHGGKTKAGRRL